MTNKPRLVLHVGLPKTASTSLQSWAYQHRGKLAEHGVNYGENVETAFEMKHQYLVVGLLQGDLSAIAPHLAALKGPVAFLSTEGLTNHLYDFSPDALAEFRSLLSDWSVTLLLATREPAAWVKAYWKQVILNVPIDAYDYGKAFTLSEFSQRPRPQRLMDHARLAEDLAAAYGADRVISSDFRELRAATLDALGFAADIDLPPFPHEHTSASDGLIEIARQINGLGIDAELRAMAQAVLQITENTGHSNLKAALLQNPESKFRIADLQHLFSQIEPNDPDSDDVLNRVRDYLTTRR